MKRGTALVLLLAALFGAGLVWLFGRQLAAGDTYPEYSSLRSDPAGCRVLHDSLARLPYHVIRNYQPLEMANLSGTTILLLGLDPNLSAGQAVEIDKLLGRGNRVVTGLRHRDPARPQHSEELEKRWGINLSTRQPFLERPLGKGMLVVLPDTDLLANHTLASGWEPALILRVLGPNRAIVFDESHLGLSESGSIVGLARRYRMHGFALGAALCAALFLWRSMSAFPPLAEAPAERQLAGRASSSGLVNLLRQSVPPARIAFTAWTLWLKGNPRDTPEARRTRAAELAAGAGDPLRVLAAIQEALQPKGTHDARSTARRA